MKKGKLLILLVAMLSLAILFVACDETGAEDGTGIDSSAQSGSEVASEVEQTFATEGDEANDEQEFANHEMHSYFDLSDEVEADPLASIARVEGEIVQVNYEHHLAVIKNKTIDALENETTKVQVYDLLTGEVIFEDSVTKPYGKYAPDEEAYYIDVEICYPVIKVVKTSYYDSDEGEGTEYKYSKDISCYLAKKDGGLVHSTNYEGAYYYYGEELPQDVFKCDEYYNGLVCFTIGDKYIWIDKDMNIIRTVETIVTNYDYIVNPNFFDCEYKGYLYSYNDKEMMVFNHSGIVSARYAVDEQKTTIQCFVLDNGNVLVQQFTDVGIYQSYDFMLNGARYVMKSMIVNCVTGDITDIELDCVVTAIESEYAQEARTPALKLANGRDNLATVYSIADGYVSAYASLCVLDNDCNIVYTVKNDTFGVDFSGAVSQHTVQYIGRGKYMAPMNTNGYTWNAVFTLDGTYISAINVYMGTAITDKYILSNGAIFNYKMEPVYNYAAAGYEFYTVINNDIYLTKFNFETGAEETFVVHPDSVKPELFTDGVALDFRGGNEYVTIIKDIEKDVYVVYNAAGEEILVSYEDVSIDRTLENVVLLRTQFEGKSIVYIVKCTAESDS